MFSWIEVSIGSLINGIFRQSNSMTPTKHTYKRQDALWEVFFRRQLWILIPIQYIHQSQVRNQLEYFISLLPVPAFSGRLRHFEYLFTLRYWRAHFHAITNRFFTETAKFWTLLCTLKVFTWCLSRLIVSEAIYFIKKNWQRGNLNCAKPNREFIYL